MKKTILLVALLLAAPAMAVDLSCAIEGSGSGTLTISYDASGEPNLVRAFALDVEVTGAVIASVASSNADYYIYPGTIVIAADGNVTSYGSPVAPANDPGALGALPGTQCTIEMGSLYEDANLAPADSGVLIVFNLTGVSGSSAASVSTNGTRGMIVLESAASVDANTTCAVGVVDPNIDTCWDLVRCPGQPIGDATCDGRVNALDLLKVKQAWLSIAPNAPYNCCADFTHDGRVNALDLLKIKQNWLASGLGGDLTQTCP